MLQDDRQLRITRKLMFVTKYYIRKKKEHEKVTYNDVLLELR